mgnify:FL=1
MENIINFIKNSELYIVIGLIIFVLILIILVAITYRALNKLESKYRKLMRGVDNKNLEEMVISYLDKVDEVKD